MSITLPEILPYGFRLELDEYAALNHYLRLKIIGKESVVDPIIPEVDVYSYEPRVLASKSKTRWFFSRRRYKNPNSISKRCIRTVKWGSYKITGKEREIKDPVSKACIGKKRYVVFLPSGHTCGQKTDWVVHEYSLLPQNDLPHQRDYVICHLEYRSDKKASTSACDTENPVENKSDEEAATQGYDEGEPSSGIISVSDIKNSVASAAIFEDGQLDGNADLFSQPIFLPDSNLTMENIDGFNGGLGVNYEHHPVAENAVPGPPGHDKGEPSSDIPSDIGNPVAYATISEEQGHADSLSEPTFSLSDWGLTLEDIDGFNYGHNINYEHHAEPMNALPSPPGCDEGESSGNIPSDIGNPVAYAAISEEQGHEDSLSEPIFSFDWCLTLEDIDGFNYGQNINYEHYAEPKNALPSPPGCDEGEPSGNIPSDTGNPVAHAAISEEQGHADSLTEPIFSSDWCFPLVDIDGFDDGKNIRRHEPEESPVEFLDGLPLAQYKNYYEETTINRFNDSVKPTSLKRPLDVPASGDMNVEGVDGWVKRSRSLALGE